jgi:signal transduction histidine kinase
LAHAASLLRAPRVLVIWEQPEEPFRHLALFSQGEVRHSRESAGRFGSLVAPSHKASTFLFEAPAAKRSARAGRAPAQVDPDLCATFKIRKAITAPFQRDLCRGRVFIMDAGRATDDDLLLVELIAERLGVDLEQYLLRHQLQTAAAWRERELLGRDLHDGLLQSLAAANIQLKLSANRAGSDVAAQIEETRAVLADEQHRIRRFVEDHRPVPDVPTRNVSLADAVTKRLNDVGRQWRCEVTFELTPPDLDVPPALARHLRHLLGEAVSNAARHGPASRIDVTATRADGVLSLTIADNGGGFPGLSGSYEDEDLTAQDLGPSSLRSRVAELGGTLRLETSPDGSRITVRLPL